MTSILESAPASPRPETGCPACRAPLDGPAVYRQRSIPVQSCVQPTTAEQARSIARGDLELVRCDRCDLVFNRRFDPSTQRFADGYEETQSFSPVFRRFADTLIDELIERWRPAGATVVEIGCGKGDFLESLCRRGGCRGIGIDPAYEPGRRAPSEQVSFERRLFCADDVGLRADFLICRHTLEHIGPVGEFLNDIAALCRSGDFREAFFEVPDAVRIADEGAFWDVYYEHANYFTPAAFSAAFERAGMRVVGTGPLFHDQYLGLYAKPGPAASQRYADAGRSGARDGWQGLESARAHWQQRIDALPEPVVIWGSGSKGVAFLAGADPHRRVTAAVDINPHRQGRFMPGTGQPIVAPEALPDRKPASVIIMNPAYVDEIRADLGRLGLSPGIEVVGATRNRPDSE